MADQQQRQRVLENLYPDCLEIFPHEALEKYNPGGFHPVNLGDTFQDGRYTIRHKLGYGGFSTVWLAHDQDTRYVPGPQYLASLTWHVSLRQWVSIKFKSAAASTEDLDQDPEVSTLKQLEKRYAESAQHNPMPSIRLLDCFHHTGPNGTHNCLVMELLGPSLSNVLDCYAYREWTMRPDTMLRASCQLLDALAFLHQAGFAHGGVAALVLRSK
jgi:serine/threonine-protein kinase SRPK3